MWRPAAIPWRCLHEAGVGLWVPPAPIIPGEALAPGDAGDAVRRLHAKLAAYGYGVAVTGMYDSATRDVVAAFQRHFRPGRVDGLADQSTLRTLDALIEERDAISQGGSARTRYA
jgi:N-acetylmuramoyl-L-alanine amidase